MAGQEDIDAMTSALMSHLIQKCSADKPLLVSGMEDELVGAKFRQLAQLDSQLAEGVTAILFSLQTHTEDVLKAELNLKRAKRNRANNLVAALHKIAEIDKTYADVRRSLKRGDDEWLKASFAVELPALEPFGRDVCVTEDTSTTVHDSTKAAAPLAPTNQPNESTSTSTSLPTLPTIPLLPVFSKASQMNNVSLIEVKAPELPQVNTANAVSHSEVLRAARVVNSGSLDGSMFEHSPDDDELVVSRFKQPDFDTDSDEENFPRNVAQPQQPIVSAVKSFVPTTLSSAMKSCLTLPEKPKMVSAAGSELFSASAVACSEGKENETSKEDHRAPTPTPTPRHESATRVTSTTATAILPTLPSLPKFSSAIGRELFK